VTISCTVTPLIPAPGCLVLVLDPDNDASRVGLLRNVRRIYLDHHGVSDLPGRNHGVVLARGKDVPGSVNPVMSEYLLALALGQGAGLSLERDADGDGRVLHGRFPVHPCLLGLVPLEEVVVVGEL
jgi:hypothetical protein